MALLSDGFIASGTRARSHHNGGWLAFDSVSTLTLAGQRFTSRFHRPPARLHLVIMMTKPSQRGVFSSTIRPSRFDKPISFVASKLDLLAGNQLVAQVDLSTEGALSSSCPLLKGTTTTGRSCIDCPRRGPGFYQDSSQVECNIEFASARLDYTLLTASSSKACFLARRNFKTFDNPGEVSRTTDKVTTVELVNLEVLLLQNNHIEHFDHSTMQNLTKLRHLDLTHNFLTQFSTQVFPKSLTYLSLNSNEIKLFNYDDLYFPPLVTLNLERNDLLSIDAPALILAMPKLKMVRFGGNPIDPNEFRLAVQQFRKHNVSVNDEADEVACLYKEEVVEGVCVRLAPPRNVIREILLSLVVVLVAIAMVVTVWWVFVTINKKC
ncbi:conserved hypothetical protein [Culex quinquefasciatus]|uniref:Uncharacterized protein n=1 Tax=Culex quinquefasciatus TaxID=7176 RepID=B0XIZ2_CULQU|nr:conserved hypothetical protein [Culex quinquefasciatus]|eukprot:XP_001869614.1 conserved hypothetical protein [Culex quinquefasciatus]